MFCANLPKTLLQSVIFELLRMGGGVFYDREGGMKRPHRTRNNTFTHFHKLIHPIVLYLSCHCCNITFLGGNPCVHFLWNNGETAQTRPGKPQIFWIKMQQNFILDYHSFGFLLLKLSGYWLNQNKIDEHLVIYFQDQKEIAP